MCDAQEEQFSPSRAQCAEVRILITLMGTELLAEHMPRQGWMSTGVVIYILILNHWPRYSLAPIFIDNRLYIKMDARLFQHLSTLSRCVTVCKTSLWHSAFLFSNELTSIIMAIDGCLIPMQAPTGLYKEKSACCKECSAIN